MAILEPGERHQKVSRILAFRVLTNLPIGVAGYSSELANSALVCSASLLSPIFYIPVQLGVAGPALPASGLGTRDRGRLSWVLEPGTWTS